MNVIEILNQNEGAASVLLSLVSLIAAIGIPALIAHKQNKIALYEKRLECYQQLQALKHFNEFCSKKDDFCITGQIDPVYRCKQEYLNAHYSFLDRDYLKNSQYLQESYAALAIEKDKNLFESLINLQLFKNDKQAKQSSDTLIEFVNSLFAYVQADTIGGNPAANRIAHREALKKKQVAFSEAFSKFFNEGEASAKKKLKL